MKTSIATVSISGDLAEKLAAIAAAGFDGVEIFEADFLTYDATPKEVAAMARDQGLEIFLFQPFRDFEGMPDPQRQRAFDRAERKFDVMQDLGTDLMLVCSNTSPLALGGIDRAAEDFHALGERAARRGLRLGYEALGWGRHVADHRDAWDVVRRTDHPNVGLILDSFHTLAKGAPVETIRGIPGDRIFLVQLADAPNMPMDLHHWSRHYRNMPGEGDLPVTDFLAAALATGYDGVLSLEIFNDQFRAGSPKSIAVDGQRSLVNVLDQVRRREPAGAAPMLPDPVAVEGIAFIEFAAGKGEAEQLGRLLSTFGFAPAARHISKEVTVWRQGAINVVINTQQEGFAYAAYLAHGASVCAIGLHVPDAGAAMARAKSLGAEPFAQPVGPGELAIPAIRGVGGGLIYFLDGKGDMARVWDIEFTPVAGMEEAAPLVDCGLKTVDHIAHTVNHKEMLTWLLFHTAIFQARKTPLTYVTDPSGLVLSQVIENDAGTLRVTLNGAENHRTLAGHFIADSFGSGVQHLAFSTSDIFATADALVRAGFTPLSISPNYYDDLDARLGLDDALLERLRRSNVLYDRDGEGEYFQLYGPTFGEGKFFEIVERRGGYTGYGAANAPFRIAAQKKQLRPPGMPRL